MITKNYYRNVMYFWMFLFLLPMLGALICAILMIIGGDSSHLYLYEQGYVNGNASSSLKLEDLLSIMYALGGMSLAFNLLLFAKDRRTLIDYSPLLQFGLFILCAAIGFWLYHYDINHTPLEIQDEFFNYKGLMKIGYALSGLITFTIASLVYWGFWLLPAAKKADTVNFEKLLNAQNS